MPRRARTTETSRLSLDIPVSVRAKIEQLQEDTGADSITEVIRRAITVYDFFVHTGGKIIVRTEGEEETIKLV